MNMLKLAQDVERCQRNWKYTDIPQDHINEIVNVCTTMPTKNNISYYNLYISTDLDFNKAIYNISVDPHNKKTIKRNSQVNAPLLLIWTTNNTVTDKLFQQVDDPSIVDRDISMSIGISSGSAALTAAKLGYKTGFCKCFKDQELSILLSSKFDYNNDQPYLMLGIGLPDNNYNRRDIIENNKVIRTIDTNDKKIKTYQI